MWAVPSAGVSRGKAQIGHESGLWSILLLAFLCFTVWGNHTLLLPHALFIDDIGILIELHFRVREDPKTTKAHANSSQPSQEPIRIDIEKSRDTQRSRAHSLSDAEAEPDSKQCGLDPRSLSPLGEGLLAWVDGSSFSH